MHREVSHCDCWLILQLFAMELYSIVDTGGTEHDTQHVGAAHLTNHGRKVMSRQQKDTINIITSLNPGQIIDGCLVCCSAPACCPLCALCPCCGDAEYITSKRNASTYIYIRENSVEWNEPSVVMQPGVCCGIDPCLYDVQDHVQVLYFDDVVFDRITDQTRCCNECRTCVFGGKGETIRMDSPICCSCCQRGSFPCVCIPVCCPKAICPCILRYEIYLEDAQKGLFEIKRAREKALSSDMYKWTDKERHL